MASKTDYSANYIGFPVQTVASLNKVPVPFAPSATRNRIASDDLRRPRKNASVIAMGPDKGPFRQLPAATYRSTYDDSYTYTSTRNPNAVLQI